MNARKHIHAGEDSLILTLRTRGYRMTAPRRAIIEALTTAVSPKTAKEIAKYAKIKEPSTVYRTLAELVKEKLASEFSDAGVAYYEIKEHHHDHAVCDKCGKIEHIPCAVPEKPRALTRAGWSILSYEALYRCFCGMCKK